MVEVRGSFVGHLLWTSYMGDLKDNNNTKKNKFNYKTNRNLIISPLTQISRTVPPNQAFTFSKPTMETPEQCMKYVQS